MSESMTLEYWPLEKFIPYARNPRKNDQAVEQIAAAIKEFGFRVPVVAKSDGTIVDGHLRLKAAQRLKMQIVPVINADDMTEAQIKAFRISVNRMAELAEWDMDLLKLELEELKDMDFDLTLTGLEDDTITGLLNSIEGNDGIADPDEVPETPAEPITKPGDLYILGRHRLLCGVSTNITDVERLMDGKRADMVFTDPPYGVSYIGKTKDALTIKNDAMDEDSTAELWRAAYSGARAVLRDGGGYLCNGPGGTVASSVR